GMNLEELRQHGTRALGDVRTRAVLNLRNIRLADALAQLLANRVDQFELGHGAVQAAKRAFDLAQVANFLGERHISYRNIYIAICNILSSPGFGVFSKTWSALLWPSALCG